MIFPGPFHWINHIDSFMCNFIFTDYNIIKGNQNPFLPQEAYDRTHLSHIPRFSFNQGITVYVPK
jgi:hypothetical protein